MRVVTLEAKMTKSRPTTTWLAALGLSFFQSPISGQLNSHVHDPQPDKADHGDQRRDGLCSRLHIPEQLFNCG